MQDNTNTNQHPLEEGEKEEEMTCSYSRGLHTDMGQSFFLHQMPLSDATKLEKSQWYRTLPAASGGTISVPALARTKATLTNAHTDA